MHREERFTFCLDTRNKGALQEERFKFCLDTRNKGALQEERFCYKREVFKPNAG
jgi:hypothetical protein